MSNRPVHELRYGRIKAVIWKNEGADGNGHSMSIVVFRIYKDPNTDVWRETHSLGRDDLLVASKVMEDAFRWIHDQASQTEEEEQPTEAAA